jgi:hypothetical protein
LQLTVAAWAAFGRNTALVMGVAALLHALVGIRKLHRCITKGEQPEQRQNCQSRFH